jgi:TnpA family transposase
MRIGTAETEAILRPFATNNVQHWTHMAFAELGKAVKTVFLRRYLHSGELAPLVWEHVYRYGRYGRMPST